MADITKETANRVPWLKPYQFKKGQVANPRGRPKKVVLPNDVRKMLAEASPDLVLEIVRRALDKDDPQSGALLKTLADKMLPSLSAVQIDDLRENLPTFVMLTPDEARVIEGVAEKVDGRKREKEGSEEEGGEENGEG